MSRVDACTAHITKHEIREGAARVASIKGEAAARCAGLLEGHLPSCEIGAELQKVFAALPRQRVDELEDLVRSIAGSDLSLQIVHVEDAVISVDGDRRWPIFFRET